MMPDLRNGARSRRAAHRTTRAATGPVMVVIEDEPQIRRFLRATLASQGYRLVEAVTGEDGLRRGGDAATGSHHPGSRPPRHGRARGHPATARVDRGPDHRPVGPRPGARQDRGPGRGRRRLREQALRRGRTPGPNAGGAAACGAAARARPESRSSTSANCGWILPPTGARGAGQQVHLTPIEYRLLTTLIRHAGKVLTHNQLLDGSVGTQLDRPGPLPARLHGAAPTQARGRSRAAPLPPHRTRRRVPTGRGVAGRCASLDTALSRWPPARAVSSRASRVVAFLPTFPPRTT